MDGSISKKTWIINPTNDFLITEGPTMNVPRMQFACGKMKVGDKVIIVVAGGWNWLGLTSVELLDPTSDKGWFFGNYFFDF